MGGKVVTEVALHLVGKNANFKNQPYQLHIQKIATESFSSAGLSPKRLTEEDDSFFINEWIKDAKKFDENDINLDFAKKVGALLAKIHSIDTNWYMPHYQKLMKDYPDLSNIPLGSTFWYLMGRNWPLMFGVEHKGSMDKWIKQLIDGYDKYLECEIKPVSPASQNIVTTHGDYHIGNIVMSPSEGLKVVDFEQTHVSSAIQDITYFFFATSSIFKTMDIRIAFCASYLKEMGYPSEESDAFALALDAERCFLSVGFMSPLFQAFVFNEKLDEEIEADLKRLKYFADLSLNSQHLAEKLLETGIRKQLPFICFGNEAMTGTLVTLGNPGSGEKEKTSHERYHFLINGDGTIMPKTKEPWKGLVLGANTSGDVILTNHCNRKDRLVLSRENLNATPITGYPKLKTKAFPLLLKGEKHSGKAICRSEKQKGTWQGNNLYSLVLGDARDAANVHFERDGSIRFSDKPEQGIDCEGGRLNSGVAVHIFQFHGSANQQFVRNDDDTISPKSNTKVVMALRKGSLELQDKDKVTDEERLVFDIPEGIGYASSEKGSDSEDGCQAKDIECESNSFKLILSNPKDRGISFMQLSLDGDMKTMLDVEPSTRSLSSFKLCLVHPQDAANAKIDLKHNYINVTKSSKENNIDSNSVAQSDSASYIRIGCWD